MALRTISLREVQLANYAYFDKFATAKKLPGRFKPVAIGSGPQCGVLVGVLDRKNQNCVGRIVIPAYCPPIPAPTVEQCQSANSIQAAITRALIAVPPIVTEPSPLVHPGFRGIRTPTTTQIVLFGTTAGAIAAGAALVTAIAAKSGVTPPSFQITTADTVILQIPIPSGNSAQVERLRGGFNNASGAEAVFFTTGRSGRLLQQSFRLTSGTEMELDDPFNGDEVFTLVAKSLVTTLATALNLEVTMWQWPTPTKTDDLYSRVLRSNPSWPDNSCRPCVGA